MAPATDSGPARLEAKLLYRRLDRLFGAWERSKPQGELLDAYSEEMFGALKGDLRLQAGLVFAERRYEFELVKKVGDPGSAIVAELLERTSPALGLVFKHRVYIFADPYADNTPYRLGLLPRGACAGIL